MDKNLRDFLESPDPHKKVPNLWPEDIGKPLESNLSKMARDIKMNKPGQFGKDSVTKFVSLATDKIKNARVFFSFPKLDNSTFECEAFAITDVGGAYYTATLRTSTLSFGIKDKDLERETDVLVDGLASTLAENIFKGKATPLPMEFVKFFFDPTYNPWR